MGRNLNVTHWATSARSRRAKAASSLPDGTTISRCCVPGPCSTSACSGVPGGAGDSERCCAEVPPVMLGLDVASAFSQPLQQQVHVSTNNYSG